MEANPVLGQQVNPGNVKPNPVQLMEATPSGLHIRSVVPHVVEVCSRGQELAQPLLQQMAAKTAAYMGQVLSHRNVVPYHAQ